MTTAEVTDPPDASKKHSPRPLWKWVRRLAAVAVLLGIVLAATAWFSRDWLAAKSNDLLKAELSKRHIHAEYGESEFSMIRGLVFTDVKIHRTAEKNDPVLSISNIGIAFNPLKLVRGEAVAPRITSHGATLAAPHPEKPVELTNLDLDASIPGDRVLIEELNGELAGMQVILSGAISMKGSESGGEAPAEKKGQDGSAEGAGGIDLSPVAGILDTIGLTPRGAPPVVRAHLVRGDDGKISASGSITGKDFSWNETAIDSLDVKFATEDGSSAGAVSALRFSSIEAVFQGRSITGSGSYDVGTGTIRLTEMRSRVHLLRLISSLSPAAADALKGVSFDEPPDLTLSGTLPFGDPAKGEMKGSVSGAGLSIAMSDGKSLKLTNLNADFALAGGELKSSNLTANILGGQAHAVVAARPFESPVRLDGELKLGGLSLQQIGGLLGTGNTAPGVMHVTFKGGGAPSLTGLSGGGAINIEGAKMVSVPVFRKLGPVLKSVIPGVGDQGAGMKMTASYRLENGVFSSRDIHLEDGLLIVDGATSINLEKSYLKANATAKAKGAAKIITALAGKALEIEAEGSFDDFDWRFKNLPNLEGLTGNLLNGGIRDTAGGVGETAGEAVKGGVTEVGAAAGNLLKKTGELTGLKKDADTGEKKKGPLGRLKKVLPGQGSN